MKKSQKKQIHIGNFLVTGTDNIVTANRTVTRLFDQNRKGLQEARYKIGGKTIIIKR